MLGLAALLASGLAVGSVRLTAAEEAAGWEALGPAESWIGRLFTPTSGALLATNSVPGQVVEQRTLYRSDDAGSTWRAIPYPEDTALIAVSPADHQLLYAAGKGGVYRSVDGGDGWERVSEPVDGTWLRLEVSPADPSILYGVVQTSPPAEYGTNRWHEFRVSHDGGSTWEVVRTNRERILVGTRPCSYGVAALVPHPVSTVRVLTIEGCNDRGMNPAATISPDEGRTSSPFPDLGYPPWAATDAVGGGGVKPERWYVAVYRPGIVYSRIRHSKLVRTDDDGESWTTVFEEESGDPYKNPRPVDFVSHVAYNPQHPDDVFAVFERYEPTAENNREPKLSGFTIRMSRDAGATWSALGANGLPSVHSLQVGIDGRYLFASTPKGVYRLVLAQ